jgi:hypothetical protein
VLRCVPRTPTARSGKKKVMSYDLREVGNYARNRSILWPLKLGAMLSWGLCRPALVLAVLVLAPAAPALHVFML